MSVSLTEKKSSFKIDIIEMLILLIVPFAIFRITDFACFA